MNIPAPELNQRLSKLYSSAVHDVLRDQGFTNFVLPASIKPLHSSFKLFGPIFTIEGQLTNEHSDHETLIEWTKLLSSIPANHVGVCQPHNKDIALMGELSAETLKKRDEQLQSGVALHEDIMPSLKRWADKLSVTLPQPIARPS